MRVSLLRELLSFNTPGQTKLPIIVSFRKLLSKKNAVQV